MGGGGGGRALEEPLTSSEVRRPDAECCEVMLRLESARGRGGGGRKGLEPRGSGGSGTDRCGACRGVNGEIASEILRASLFSSVAICRGGPAAGGDRGAGTLSLLMDELLNGSSSVDTLGAVGGGAAGRSSGAKSEKDTICGVRCCASSLPCRGFGGGGLARLTVSGLTVDLFRSWSSSM